MTGIDSYSVTPLNNETIDGTTTWREGQAPSSVNNGQRQILTDTRNAWNDLPWFQYGTGDQDTTTHLAVPSVYASGTSFTITGADVTGAYHAGRPLRAVGTSTGTIYGVIASSSYNSGSQTTTVNATWDSGSLSNEALVISIGLPVIGKPVGATALRLAFDIDIKVGADGNTPIGTGTFDDIPKLSFDFTITGWTIRLDQSGSISFDIYKNTFSVGSPPNSGNTIVASAPPTVSSAEAATSSTLSGWATSIVAGSSLRFRVSSADGTVTRANLILHCLR